MRANLKRAEDRLFDEKEERRLLEDKLTRVQSDGDSKLRDAELAWEVKMRDVIKKTRSEAEEDPKERLRLQERRVSMDLCELMIE